MAEKRINLRDRLSRRVFISLLLAVAVSLCAMETVIGISQKRLKSKAEEAALNTAKRIRSIANSTMCTTKWTSESFLGSFTTCITDASYSFLEYDCRHIVTDEMLAGLDGKRIRQMLDGFASANPDIYGAGLVFPPGVLVNEPHGLAMFSNPGKVHEGNVIDRYNILGSKNFLGYKEHRYCYMLDGYQLRDSVDVMTYVFPVWKEDGTLGCEFWVDQPLKYLSRMLERWNSSQGVTAYVLNGNDQILFGSDGRLCTMPVEKALDSFSPKAVGQIMDFVHEVIPEHGENKAVIEEDSDSWYMYSCEIHPFRDRLLIMVPASSVLVDLSRLSHATMVIFFLCLLLMLLCMTYAFRHFTRMQTNKVMMERDIAVAAEIQEGFLPKDVPHTKDFGIAAFHKPAKMVAGDLYDYMEKDGKLYFCVGDVCGKGVPAALLMAIVSSHFHNAVRSFSSAKEISEAINVNVSDRNDKMLFCTMFIGIYDPSDGKLEFCNAGHTLPVLKSADRTIFVESKPNLPFGFEADNQYSADVLTLSEGDSLLVYSDGVTEALDTAGKFFTDERLLGLVASLDKKTTASETADAVAKAVESFAKGAEQSDDITILCLRRD